MKEPALFLGISLVLTSIVVWVFANSEKVRARRIKEMAEEFARNSILTNLKIKKMILKGRYEADCQQLREQVEAIDMALDWQRKHSRADVPTTPQDGRGI